MQNLTGYLKFYVWSYIYCGTTLDRPKKLIVVQNISEMPKPSEYTLTFHVEENSSSNEDPLMNKTPK